VTRLADAALVAAFGALVYVTALLFSGCYHGNPPTPNDPTAPPPAVDLPRDPLAPPFTPFYQRTDGGTNDSR